MSVRRSIRQKGLTLTVDNVAEVRALLETSPALQTKVRTQGNGGIEVTVTTPRNTWPSVALFGDEVVTAELSFEIRCGEGAPRSTLPRYLMDETTAAGIRHEVWTSGIREAHRNQTGRHTHRCSCQYGTSWQCSQGQLHHKCIYGRDSAMWRLPVAECTVTWPDGQDTGARVWLADRVCRAGCGCDCHADVMSRPPAPMSGEAAAWVREFVWTKRMRKVFADTPGAVLHCECQFGPSGHCNAGKHGKCWHGTNEPYLSPETYVCGSDGTSVLSFAENFAHPTGSATGPHQTSHAMVWLADRACRWRCPCDCHTGTTSAPEPPAAVPQPRIDKPVQLDLFDVLAS